MSVDTGARGLALAARNTTQSRLQWWARNMGALRPISMMSSPPTVTVSTSTISTLNASNNAASLPTAGKYPALSSAGFVSSVAATGNPNNNSLQTRGPANTDGSYPKANLARYRFSSPLPQFEVCFVENQGSRINALIDGQFVTLGGVGGVPNFLQSAGTRYLKFDFGTDVTSYGVVGGNVTAGGTGYAAADTVTLSGGTFTRPATYRVGFVSTGAVGNLYTQDPGDYTVLPSYPAATTSSGSGTGATVTPPFKFPRHTTFKPRQIELLLEGAYLYGINYTAPASGEAPITPYVFNTRIPSLYWLGDSQDSNQYGTFAGGHVGFLVAMRLGLADNIIIDAQGGTGFSVNNGVAPAFEHANRVNAVIAAAPDILYFPFSQNVGTQVASTAAAISFVTQIQSALPNTLLIMSGPAYGHQTWHLTAMQAVMAAAPRPANIRMIDSITEAWDAGGSAGFLTNDTTHWGEYGNFEWRSKLLAEHIGPALVSMIV